MAVEAKRKCGFRKINGIYLVTAPGGVFDCGKLPLKLIPCPLCDHVPGFNRGLQRIVPKNVIHSAAECSRSTFQCASCPLDRAMATEAAALCWVGDRFYSPQEFVEEAHRLGVSKRISEVPNWLKVGTMWVFVAHPKLFSRPCPECRGGQEIPLERSAKGKARPEVCEFCEDGLVYEPGIFYAFIPQRVEKMVPQDAAPEVLERLVKDGYTPVFLPADDPDHAEKRKE
jgi:hypothetical protein